MSEYDCDVIIAGGGLVGASLALALSHHSDGRLRILVVEGFALPSGDAAPVYTPSFDARSTALSSGSMSIFASLSVADLLQAQAAVIESIHVSDRGHFGSTLLQADKQGWPALGYVVENAWLGRVLLSAMQSAAGVSTLSPATVKTAVSDERGVQVEIEQDGTQCTRRAALLVVADGANSGLRSALGIEAREVDYGQSGLIANVCFDRPHDGRAYERFTADGPIAMLPLTNAEDGRPRASLVWTLPDDRAAAMSAASDDEFIAALQTAFGYRMGRITGTGKRDCYPLKLVEAGEQVRPGVVIAGNAAHSLHPVAGQGFNLALRDCWRLAQSVCAAAQTGEALGGLAVLQRYADWQDEDQAQTVLFSDGLIRLFGNNNPLLSVLRNLGLVALDMLPAAKDRFVLQAAGRAPGRATGQTAALR